MNQKIFKIYLLSSLFMTLMLTVSIANAHFYFGDFAGDPFAGIEVHHTQLLKLNCPATTARFEVSVLDEKLNRGIVSVTTFKDGKAATASDPVQQDSDYGPTSSLEAGPGTYYMIASQTALTGSSSTKFTILYHCLRANGSEPVYPTAVRIQP